MMRRPSFLANGRCALLSTLFAAAAAVIVASAPTTAAASLSDQLAQKIAEARRYERNRNFDAAFAIYEKAMKMDQGTPQAMRALLKHRSELFEQVSMFDLAEGDLTAASRIVPNDATAYGDRGYFYMRRGRYGDALGDFVTGSRLDPQNPMYLYAAARSLVAVEDFAGAVAFYTEAIKAGPNDGKLYLARAEAQVRLKRWTEAQADYDRAQRLGISTMAEKYFLHAGSGYVALVLGDYDTALTRLGVALAIDPDATNVLMWRGYANERRGYTAAALRDYERAARLLPNDLAARDGTRRMQAAVRETGAATVNR